ncbi:hypothetical protein [Tenacibaculum sp. IB213877]|uniref:hypothetical protein n=1 Tax=Tenacibaculum sp. IB213877 TaxID=3097351 RepID=UPI002A5AD10E|nr:hypothetical protein [Tenacibaculum sp. IB213877]MDY0780704.1 hypothetical protein [Tenacibaculum sp. IB213877]
MKVSVFFLTLLCLVSFTGKAQYKFSSYAAHNSIKEAIGVSSDIIKARTLDFEKKADDKPLMFHQVKKKIGELNRLSNNLVGYIEKIQKEVDSERVLYELIDDDFYENLLFTSRGDLSSKGEKLKIKIDSLYNFSSTINIHRLTHLDNFIDEHFNTKGVFYADEREIDFFEYLFYDKSNYGMMMTMNYLLLDVKTFQLLYFGTVMSY